MNEKILALFNYLEVNRQLLINKFDIIDANLLNFKPATLSWSVLEVCHHLVVSEFPENLNWTELNNRWSKVRVGMRERLTKIPEDLKNKLIYKHPSAGRLTLYQMLTFFKIHISRHEDQIARLIKAGDDLKRSNQ